jgi:HAD superfamily hydrolase (TIGR01509 family)
MTLTNFDAIIFDMDGLLVDSERIWYQAEDEFIQSFGHVYTQEAREAIIGLRIDEFTAVLKDLYKLEPPLEELVATLEGRVLELIKTEVKPQRGAQEVIDFVIANNIPHAIASSSSKKVIDTTLEAQGWSDLFKIRCSADDDARGKPAPDVYLRAVKTLGFDPSRCLALEDSPNGSRAAVAAGLTCYAVPDASHSAHTAFEGITPHVFNSLFEVLEKLKA